MVNAVEVHVEMENLGKLRFYSNFCQLHMSHKSDTKIINLEYHYSLYAVVFIK